jgi:hypothetical protein
MASPLHALNLVPEPGRSIPGLVPVRGSRAAVRIDEEAAIRQADAIGDIDFVFFRRFSDERSSQVAAYVIDNSDDRFNEQNLAMIHQKLWLNGSAPLLYVGWQTRVDVLSCARGPDFWREGEGYKYNPAAQIEVTAQISQALEEKHHRFSAFRLSDGTFWENPENFELAQADKAAHRRLIKAVVEADRKLGGAKNPLLRRLLLLTVLIKYLEDRDVFPKHWFARFREGATCFFDILQHGTPSEVRKLLDELQTKFNGDVFDLPENNGHSLTKDDLRRLADLAEARTEGNQRYLWKLFSFTHIPVEVLSHLYQRFAQRGKGAVFTPPFVASLMLDYALPYDRLTGTEKILDPTCGSGVFLVGAFRRLIHFWRSQNGWKQPDASTLKTILKQSIFGVELQEEAMHLTAFSLALAVCDALQPNVIWRDLRFDKLANSNLLGGDFFEHIDKLRPASGNNGFGVIIGNPPFMKFSEAAERVHDSSKKRRVSVPDKQMAYLIAEEAMSLLQDGGRMCLIQHHGFLYNEKAQDFQKSFVASNQVEAILDFTSIRKLYDGADPKTVALVVTKQKPSLTHRINHYTFRRTFSVQERIGFELDHYDRHLVTQQAAQEHTWVWRVNLLGGGRLVQLAERMAQMPKLRQFVEEKGWDYGEGFIAASTGRREPALWLTGKPFLPTRAFTIRGIDESKLGIVVEKKFRSAYTESRYSAPIILIREHDSLPCEFRSRGFLAYKAKIVGIHAEPSQETVLRQFYDDFLENRSALRAFCVLFGTQALLGKATAILKRDIDVLPWPQDGMSWDLNQWEKILCEDVVDLTAEFVRRGQNSQLLRKRVNSTNLQIYTEVFVKMLGSVYTNLRAVKSLVFDGIAYQAFCFGKTPEMELPDDSTLLHKLIYVQHGAALRTVRVLRFYDRNVILIVKPDRLRYWIRSTAIRDADETLADLQKQGY